MRRREFITVLGSMAVVGVWPLPIWKRTHAQVERLLAGADLELLRRDLRALS